MSPSRLLFGASYTFGNLAIVSVDYEREWYNGIRVKNVPEGADFHPEAYKAEFKNNYKGTNTLRAGVEVRPLPIFAVRLGGGYTDSMFKDRQQYYNSPSVYESYYITGGLGINLGRNTVLDVAYQMFAQGKNKLELTALHLTVGSDVNPLHTDNFEEVSFGPILYGAKKLGIQIQTRYEVSNNAGVDICSIVNNEGYDFLLVGSGISMSNTPDDIAASHYRASFYNRYFKRFKAPESWFYPGALLKDETKMFIEQSNCPVGVFVNRNFVKASNVIVVIDSEEDLFLLGYAQTLLKSTHGSASVLDKSSSTTPGNEVIKEGILRFTEDVKQTTLLREKDLTPQSFNGFNFMLISYKTWNDVSEHRKEALQKMPSTLILSK